MLFKFKGNKLYLRFDTKFIFNEANKKIANLIFKDSSQLDSMWEKLDNQKMSKDERDILAFHMGKKILRLKHNINLLGGQEDKNKTWAEKNKEMNEAYRKANPDLPF